MPYIALEEAKTYFSSQLYTQAWDSATDEVRQKALSSAENNINRQRWNVDLIALKPVPTELKEAVCEEALALLDYGNSKRRKLQQQGVKSFSNGSMSESYRDSAGKGLFSQNAKELLKEYLVGSVPIV